MMSAIAMFTIEKCLKKGGYTVKPEKQMSLHFAEIKEKFSVLFSSSVALVLETSAGKVVVHRYGELLFQDSSDLSLIKKIAQEVYSL